MNASTIRSPLSLLGAYFGAQICARLFASPGLELDEAEQVLWTQDLSLGYWAQTPIVTDNAILGGVLRTCFPEVTVVIWKSDGPLPAELHGPNLLIRRQGGHCSNERASHRIQD